MNIKTVSQPETQLGNEISRILDGQESFSRIVFVSAFVALRTILRLRDRLLAHVSNGSRVRFTVGVDLNGTSREVLEELLRWPDCEIFIFHNTIPRSTFHPKLYLFESATTATLFVGSNNLTEGGFYTNYEAATSYSFELATDGTEFTRLLRPLEQFIEPQQGPTVKRLDHDLIRTLVARGELPTETEARRHGRRQPHEGYGDVPASPFSPVEIARPPLLSETLRQQEPRRGMQPPPAQVEELLPTQLNERPHGILVWKKILPRTDALQVGANTHPVGGVRLTQAGYENPQGQRIDQTTYFRQLFADFLWEWESHGHLGQEHTFVRMRVIIRGYDHGIRNFEISHKPSGEAGQANYTTILKWGRDFSPIVRRENLTGALFSLYEMAEQDADFLIEITQ